MTLHEEQVLHHFETRVRQLILAYRELQTENLRLKQSLAEKEEALKDALALVDSLRKDYGNLKLARMMTVDADDLQGAKNRLNKLIREVDKCIALLNV